MDRRSFMKTTVSTLASLGLGKRAAQATTTAGPADRRTISLDGIWQIAEGRLDTIPARFERQAPVPGLVDMATPSFIDPGQRVDHQHPENDKDPRRDAFWYRRTFQLQGPVPAVARLKVNKAAYGTRVFLNGVLLGDHAPIFTPGYFDARPALRTGTNNLVIRIGADRAAIRGQAECGNDGEKDRYIPGIYDSVGLILSGTPQILNVQVAPDLEHQTANVHVWLRYTGTPAAESLHTTIREASTGRVAGEANTVVAKPLDGDQQEVVVKIPILHCRLWSPEDPFLYGVEVRGSADSFTARFGMRSFRLDPTTGHAVLNGRTYFLRGTNVLVHRFFEDPLRGDKPWREEWVRRLFQAFSGMHYNATRVCLGFPPEFWYRIADEEGIMIQDEYPIWSGDPTPYPVDEDRLAVEYREWMQEQWNHPSVVIWDACNETDSPGIVRALRRVRGFDYSNRPWDDGWNVPMEPGDSDEAHPYHFIFGPNQPFRLSKLADDPGTKAGILIAQPFAEEKLHRTNPVIINEYCGLWLNRDGTPTALSKSAYDYLLEPSATTAQRRLLYARTMAAITEFFRAHRLAAGVLDYGGLDYSLPDANTSDDWVDIEKLTMDPDFYKYVRDAFAPVGLMVDSWADEYPGGSTKKFPVLLINDLNDSWNGDVRFRLLLDGKTLQEVTMPATVAALGSDRMTFSISIPVQPALYQVEATLLSTPAGPVHSLRDFSVLTPEEREARRNLAANRPLALSFGSNCRAVAVGAASSQADSQPALARSAPEWLLVDLGQSQMVSRLIVAWQLAWNWNGAAWQFDGIPESYSVELSDDNATWKLVRSAEQYHAPTDTIRFPAINARWIRVYVPQSHPPSGYPLPVIEAYH